MSLCTPSPSFPGASEWVNSFNWSNPVTSHDLLDYALMISPTYSINGATHSLEMEMRVSVILPLLLIPMVRWRSKGILATVALIIAVILAIQIALTHPGERLGLPSHTTGGSVVERLLHEIQYVLCYALIFVLGSAIALYREPIRLWLSRTPCAGAASLLAGLLVIQTHWTPSHTPQMIMVAVGSALVVIGALASGSIARALSHPSLTFLGRMSYSLYLVHVPIILCFTYLMHPPIWLLLVCVPPTSLLLGWVFHETVAEPCAALGHGLARVGRPGVRPTSADFGDFPRSRAAE